MFLLQKCDQVWLRGDKSCLLEKRTSLVVCSPGDHKSSLGMYIEVQDNINYFRELVLYVFPDGAIILRYRNTLLKFPKICPKSFIVGSTSSLEIL